MRNSIRSLLPRARSFAVVLVAVAGAGGFVAACSATTGIDVEVRGGDVAGLMQIQVTGQLGDGGATLTPVKAPSTPRPFGAVEDVRIVMPDNDADQVVWVTVQGLDANNNPVGDPKPGAAVLVGNHTKRIRVCYGDASCSPDGGQ